MILSSILSDGMVLQRKAKVAIWGKSEPLQTVRLSFCDKDYGTKADGNGDWLIELHHLEPGGPFAMTLSAGDEKLVIQDILVGDVWLLGGQSNMELPVGRTLDLFENELAEVNLPHIRHFTVPMVYDFHGPRQHIAEGKWISANPRDVMAFSAAGFFCARELFAHNGVPVGLINAAVGGTPIEAWMSEETLRRFAGYEDTLNRCKDDAYVADTMRKDTERAENWFKHLNENDQGLKDAWYSEILDTSEWKDFAVPNSWANSELEHLRGAVWFRKEIELPASMTDCEAKLCLGTIVDADDAYINGTFVGSTGYRYPPRRYKVARGLLKPGRNSIAVRVISYQGIGEFLEDMPYKLIANGHELDLQGTWKYRVGAVTDELPPQTFFQYMPGGVFNGMIAPLKHYAIKGVLWYQGESNAHRAAGYRELFRALVADWRGNWENGNLPFIFTQLANFGGSDPQSVDWAELREEQRRSLDIPGTAMAVTIDIGQYNELHPQDKKTLGRRLSLCARKIADGEDLVYSGPLYKSMERKADAIHVHFDHIGSGLATSGGDLAGFEICGPDGKFQPAHAVISGETVIVSSEAIKQPQHVRYGWRNNPAGANLINREGLPASPFTTEN